MRLCTVCQFYQGSGKQQLLPLLSSAFWLFPKDELVNHSLTDDVIIAQFSFNL